MTVRQASDAGHVRGNGPHHRDEAEYQEGLAGAFVHEGFGSLPGRGGYAAAELRGPEALAQQMAGSMAESVPDHDGAGGHRDDPAQVQAAGTGQGSRGEHENEGGNEGTHQQYGFSNNCCGQHRVRGGRGMLLSRAARLSIALNRDRRPGGQHLGLVDGIERPAQLPHHRGWQISPDGPAADRVPAVIVVQQVFDLVLTAGLRAGCQQGADPATAAIGEVGECAPGTEQIEVAAHDVVHLPGEKLENGRPETITS